MNDNETSPSHYTVLLTFPDDSNFVEVSDQRGCRMTTWLSAVSNPFVSIPPKTGTSFPPDFGLSDSEHEEAAPPDDKAHPPTFKDMAPCMTQEVSGDIGPMAAYSLHAVLDNSFKSIFGVASAYGADDVPMHFRHLFSEGARVVDRALLEIKDENAHYQSALTPISIAVMIERLALPI
jgi:hypothetical protein